MLLIRFNECFEEEFYRFLTQRNNVSLNKYQLAKYISTVTICPRNITAYKLYDIKICAFYYLDRQSVNEIC